MHVLFVAPPTLFGMLAGTAELARPRTFRLESQLQLYCVVWASNHLLAANGLEFGKTHRAMSHAVKSVKPFKTRKPSHTKPQRTPNAQRSRGRTQELSWHPTLYRDALRPSEHDILKSGKGDSCTLSIVVGDSPATSEYTAQITCIIEYTAQTSHTPHTSHASHIAHRTRHFDS
mgnify:CR=1 FL=1